MCHNCATIDRTVPGDLRFAAALRYRLGLRPGDVSIIEKAKKPSQLALDVKVMSPHPVRHSSITAALDKSNGNVRAVQRLSRHADLRTLQIYDDNRQNLQEQITDLLEDALEDD